MKFGYYTDMFKNPITCLKSDKMTRFLEGAGPYYANKNIFKGTDVILITPKVSETAISIDELSDPILVTDDKKGERVWFLPPKNYKSITDYAREYPSGAIDVKTSTGKELSLVPFTSCSRLTDFITGGLGDFADNYGRFASLLFERALNDDDEIKFFEMADLIFYAVNQCYAMTRYVFNWVNNKDKIIADSDYEMLFAVIGGGDPKKYCGA